MTTMIVNRSNSVQDSTFYGKFRHRNEQLDPRMKFASASNQEPHPEAQDRQQHQQQQHHSPQKVAVVGTGAVGSYYGARLAEAGHDVHFYMRNEHYEAALTQGLTVTSVDGNMHIAADQLQVYPTTDRMAEAAAEIPFDWVVVALKSSALEAIPDIIFPLLTPTTRVIVIMNGMIENDLMDAIRIRTGQKEDGKPLLCCQTLYGGMALICCNRVAPAVTDHSYFGLLTAGVASTQSTNPDDDELAFRHLFGATPIDLAYDQSLVRGRWRKMLWNLPFNGISVAMGGITVDQIVRDPGLRQLAYEIIDEAIQAANAELEYVYGPGNYKPLGVLDRYAMMKLSDDMGPYKTSTFLDFVHRRPMEVKYLFREPLDRATKYKVPAPHLSTIVRQVEAFQRLYKLY
jgi:2-dehydropantoate 2-reductase